jgi:hypothetical protein
MLVFISPPGELTIMVYFMMVMGRLCSATNLEHTQYHILGLLGFLGIHMVGLPIGEVLLPLRTLLLVNSLGLLSIGTILSHVAWQSALDAYTKRLTSLRGGILLGLGCRT